MSRISTALVKLFKHPLVVVEVIIAVGLLVSGLYTAGPWYVPSATTPLGQAIDSTLVRMAIGGFYALSALTSLWGGFRDWDESRSIGLFMMFLSYSFITILRWISIGLVPLTWIFSLTLALIVAFLYFRIRLLK
ncbi:membrane protein [Streptomyces phage Braelyn]|uniref:Membrane protein n=1 Tax=Streptomyces phage Braelyn TaxID=2593356 RepID=A0A514U277_9CAUD|nr:membrane protein [Streptomyces phage Braelyn]QDK03040.1 membrane protein [Streptomyces phage Braelyn]